LHIIETTALIPTKFCTVTETTKCPLWVVWWGPSSPRKRAHPPTPIFGPYLLWPDGWTDEDATWYGSRPWPRPHCIRRGPSSLQKGHSSPPFSAHVYCGHDRPSQLLLSCCCFIAKLHVHRFECKASVLFTDSQV